MEKISYEDEIWKPVVGWEGLYEVSNKGRVKSLSRHIVNEIRQKDGSVHHQEYDTKEKIVRQHDNGHSYLKVIYPDWNEENLIYKKWSNV